MPNHPPERLQKILRDQWFKGLMLEVIARDQQARNENDLNSLFISKSGGGGQIHKNVFCFWFASTCWIKISPVNDTIHETNSKST